MTKFDKYMLLMAFLIVCINMVAVWLGYSLHHDHYANEKTMWEKEYYESQYGIRVTCADVWTKDCEGKDGIN